MVVAICCLYNLQCYRISGFINLPSLFRVCEWKCVSDLSFSRHGRHEKECGMVCSGSVIGFVLLNSTNSPIPAPMRSHSTAAAAAGPKFSVDGFGCTTSNGNSRFRCFPVPLRLSLKSSSKKLGLIISKNSSYDRKTIVTRFRHFVPSASAELSSADGSPSLNQRTNRKLAVAAWSAVTLVLAVGNRVLQKLALVPMKDYPFFLAQLNSFAFVVIFFSLRHARYRTGIVTDEMLTIPKFPFVIIGFLESVATVSGMYAGAMLPGPAIPLLYQTFLIWQLLFSSVLLGRRYSLNQILGCFLVAGGVVVAVTSGANHSRILSGVGLFWPGLMIASSAFQAGASIVKESVFRDAAIHLKGKSLDIFVVNSFGSGFQALFILLFLPILSSLKGITLYELPSYFETAAACFLNFGPNIAGCDGAPLLPLLYIASNIIYNISILNLLKVSNAIVTSLAARSSVPIAIYVLSLPLPYLAKRARLSPFFHLGSLILVVGLILYNTPSPQPQEQEF